MTDQDAGEFTVREVLRESFALFFSKNFFVFASVPFFLFVVGYIMLFNTSFSKWIYYTPFPWEPMPFQSIRFMLVPLSYGFIACAVPQALSRGYASFSESLSRTARRLFWLSLITVVTSITFRPAYFMTLQMLEKLGVPLTDTSVSLSNFFVSTVAGIPFLLCVCLLCLAVPVCVIEKTGVKSLGRSIALTKGRYVTMFTLLLIAWFSGALYTLSIDIISAVVRSKFDYTFVLWLWILRFLRVFLWTAFLTFGCIVGAVAYCGLRVVKEGADFEEMAGPKHTGRLASGSIAVNLFLLAAAYLVITLLCTLVLQVLVFTIIVVLIFGF